VRVECESCRELVLAGFEVEGETVRARCPSCQHVMTAELARAGPTDDAPLCPKCGALRRADAAACASCGLTAARMAAYSSEREAAVPGALHDAWTRATERWGDAAVHDELLRMVAGHSAYAWAAGRYRTRARDPVARRQLERLRRAAEATLFASATARSEARASPYRASRSVLAILIVAVVVGLLYATVIRDSAPPPRAPASPVRPLEPGRPVSPSTIR
jgi:hypothetical protein